jgi:hypothetical protein
MLKLSRLAQQEPLEAGSSNFLTGPIKVSTSLFFTQIYFPGSFRPYHAISQPFLQGALVPLSVQMEFTNQSPGPCVFIAPGRASAPGSMCVCMCVHVCTLCLYAHVCACLCVYVHVWECVCTHACVSLPSLSMYTYISSLKAQGPSNLPPFSIYKYFIHQ